LSVHQTPLVSGQDPGTGARVLWWGVRAAVRTSLAFSPRPTALLVRRVFAAGGARTARILDRHAPSGIMAIVDESYGDDADMLLDVYRPASTDAALPLVVWVHGGAWVGGSKEELAGWCRLIASDGRVVVAPRYSLAPEHRYPAPLHQVMAAIAHARAERERLGIDPSRIVIGGDSAGAQIAAQLAALVTTPGYADLVGVDATITPEELRGLVLACGPYDMALMGRAGSPTGARLVHAVLWAYSGARDPGADQIFRTASVVDHISAAFPPSLITVGDADPLRVHSELLVERLRVAGAPEPDTLLFPEGHQHPLGHEYQFDLDTHAGQRFLERMRGFLRRTLD
jgi:acetyl esterase/lipase